MTHQPIVRISDSDLDNLMNRLEVHFVKLAECLVSSGWRLALGSDRPNSLVHAPRHHMRSRPKIIFLNSISGSSLFSTRIRKRAPSQLFNMKSANAAAEN